MTTVRLPRPSGHTELKPSPTYDVATLSDKRAQTLNRLLKEGHDSVAPLREPKLILHSHLPHLLGSAYALGASSDLLQKCYDNEVSSLVNIEEGFIRGDRISKKTWRDFLAQKPYTVAYVDFFSEEIKEKNNDWKSLLNEYLYATGEPIINGYTGGLGHPFIHLAYAYEFQSKEVAAQALSLGCTEYFDLHGLIDHPPPDNSTYKTQSFADVIERVRKDTRLDGLLTVPGITNFGPILQHHFQTVVEHWNAWEVVDPVQQFEQLCDVSLLLALSDGDADKSFDFYNVHLLTICHALRVIWQEFPAERRVALLRQYALFAILIYIAQLRPDFGMEGIEAVKTDGRDWNWVVETALAHRWVLDSHFFKVVRAPKVLAETYGEKDDFYLKAAIKFLTEFRGWEGFGLGVEGFLPSRDGYRPE
ncbi:Protein of unknown function (DUF4243) domain containing protein [Hyaloscypha variabilis]|uniref:MGS207 protein n=1 Tax=Hyaloscypha variabilis (strain UAMH 11265 / GT02V1 / F) TaxID=1149755 RepID=A0A2J6RP46_HYAVF|nr:hypothetical protein L207DRAFT_633348 [Hyaloscypha variabilis F]